MMYENIPFSMNVNIQQATPVQQVIVLQGPSPSVSLGTPPKSGNNANIPNSHFAQIALSSTGQASDTRGDIIILIKAQSLSVPFTSIDPPPTDKPTGVTLAPFSSAAKLAPIMEFIVLVDRSASMSGIKLEVMQQALVVLVQGLPSRNTTFNIISFGAKVSKLWPISKTYNAVTLSLAKTHIE